MLDRYVDDGDLISEVPLEGTRYDALSGETVWSVEAAEDENMEDDRRTMRLLREVADSVHPMLHFSEKFP